MSSNGFDPMAQYARLSERVENQGKDIVDLRSNMNTGFQTINTSISQLSNELRNSSKTQWPVIWAAAGVCFTVLATGGAFFYNSLSKGQDRLDLIVAKNAESAQSGITAVVDKMVTQKEMEWRTARGAEDRARMEASIKEVREAQVPRAELERVWRSQDQMMAQLQKQIDEQKANSAAVYTPRDVLLDNRERIDRLERQRLSPGG
ncbi:hypothetical protein [Agrobacterium tumefaciens]|uniref:hypothetical protein n=1 Tax=Agrobacterium tumefaciens TaxID=358 RepID=UPI001573BC27|nr:hypothetical protein [Agrobacterium tumefaciens]NTB01060.1 hypothetical protein [Agrobacterium tumefaciens]